MSIGPGGAVLDRVGAIVFDFDGTLVDSAEAICGAMERVLVAHGYDAPEPAWTRRRIGRPLKELFTEAAGPLDEGTLDAWVLRYRIEFFALAPRHVRCLPGVAAAVRHFAGRIPLAIATARNADGALTLLEQVGLRDAFAAVVGIEHVSRPKPDPEMPLRALSLVGVAPARAIMVGDTPDDVMAGRRAGLRTVAVTSGAHDRAALAECAPDVVIERLDELIDCVGIEAAPPIGTSPRR